MKPYPRGLPRTPRRAAAAAVIGAALVAPSSAQESRLADWWHGPGLSGSWGGLRDTWAEAGVEWSGSLVVDHVQVFDGGVDRGASTLRVLDLALVLDLDRCLGWSGASLVADAYSVVGSDPSELAGDEQALSNLATGENVHQLGELYLEQHFAPASLRLKLGKLDAGLDFGYADNAGEFVNTGISWLPTQFTQPTYPDPASGGALFLEPDAAWSLRVGVYDGATAAGHPTGAVGPETLFGEPADLAVLGEGALHWELGARGLAGQLKLGYWHHNGDFERFAGGEQEGTEGAYACLDHELWRASPGGAQDQCVPRLAAFGALSVADEEVATIDVHVAGGLVWQALFADRSDDALGLGFSRAGISSESGASADAELAVELFYRCQLGPWLALKPDLQWIHNPAGDGSVDPAWVFALRLETTL